MAKKLEHMHDLDITYSVKEDFDFPEREEITVKVTEFNFSRFGNELDLEKYQEDNYLELKFIRIITGEYQENDLHDILDSHSGDLFNAIKPIMDENKEEFMSAALNVETTMLMSNIIYLDTAKIHGDFSEEALATATSKAFKILSKGSEVDNVLLVAYQNKTFYNGENEIDESKAKDIVKELNLFKLPYEASGIQKKNNVVAIASGVTLNMDYEQVVGYTVKAENKKKVAP